MKETLENQPASPLCGPSGTTTTSPPPLFLILSSEVRRSTPPPPSDILQQQPEGVLRHGDTRHSSHLFTPVALQAGNASHSSWFGPTPHRLTVFIFFESKWEDPKTGVLPLEGAPGVLFTAILIKRPPTRSQPLTSSPPLPLTLILSGPLSRPLTS